MNEFYVAIPALCIWATVLLTLITCIVVDLIRHR